MSKQIVIETKDLISIIMVDIATTNNRSIHTTNIQCTWNVLHGSNKCSENFKDRNSHT